MTSPMFSFDQLQFRYEPFPIGMARPLMDGGLYREFVDQYPDQDQFADLSVVGYKYSLSEKNNSREYHQLIRSRPVWKEFHRWIKSDEFIKTVLDSLKERNLELGYAVRPLGKRLARRASKFARATSVTATPGSGRDSSTPCCPWTAAMCCPIPTPPARS